jgi:hypothetical protein
MAAATSPRRAGVIAPTLVDGAADGNTGRNETQREGLRCVLVFYTIKVGAVLVSYLSPIG